MLNNLSICENFVHDFKKDNSENLLFYGSTGLGKTYMCNCIAKELLDKGNVVIYQTSFRILDILEDYKFRRDTNNQISEDNYKNLFDCDLLIIDDLGTELNNSFTSGEIFNIVNTRLVAGKKIIISTNLTPSQIGNTYTQRTLSRILDKFRILEFTGDDLRWERFK
ncbi:DNA replication protein DnaC [Clostridioides difficile]|nr:DNA replication protein DnaC [Clostridioides difficile]